MPIVKSKKNSVKSNRNTINSKKIIKKIIDTADEIDVRTKEFIKNIPNVGQVKSVKCENMNFDNDGKPKSFLATNNLYRITIEFKSIQLDGEVTDREGFTLCIAVTGYPDGDFFVRAYINDYINGYSRVFPSQLMFLNHYRILAFNRKYNNTETDGIELVENVCLKISTIITTVANMHYLPQSRLEWEVGIQLLIDANCIKANPVAALYQPMLAMSSPQQITQLALVDAKRIAPLDFDDSVDLGTALVIMIAKQIKLWGKKK